MGGFLRVRLGFFLVFRKIGLVFCFCIFRFFVRGRGMSKYFRIFLRSGRGSSWSRREGG